MVRRLTRGLGMLSLWILGGLHVGAAPISEDLFLQEPALPILSGVVLESVGLGSALEKAGLQPGDRLISWKRLPNPPANPEPERGMLRSPLDWWALCLEQR